jgi:hypothetical protein
MNKFILVLWTIIFAYDSNPQIIIHFEGEIVKSRGAIPLVRSIEVKSCGEFRLCNDNKLQHLIKEAIRIDRTMPPPPIN